METTWGGWALAAGCLLYTAFWCWWGGNGKALSEPEKQALLAQLQGPDSTPQRQQEIDELQALLATDDGKAFVMQNLVRYRPKALYPPGFSYGDDPREADKRYGRAIWWNLLRYGNLLLFVGRRSGVFLTPEGADAWHYVAMVRYRSRRDFMRFAIASDRADIFVHKWAAIEKTHIFPVKPVVSLFTVRLTVGLVLLLAAIWIGHL
jgi:hypothetical protein